MIVICRDWETVCVSCSLLSVCFYLIELSFHSACPLKALYSGFHLLWPSVNLLLIFSSNALLPFPVLLQYLSLFPPPSHPCVAADASVLPSTASSQEICTAFFLTAWCFSFSAVTQHLLYLKAPSTPPAGAVQFANVSLFFGYARRADLFGFSIFTIISVSGVHVMVWSSGPCFVLDGNQA